MIRVDDRSNDAHVDAFEINGKLVPAAGPGNVTVKEIVFSAADARSEVIRLNELNVDKKCRFYWQSTDVYQQMSLSKVVHAVAAVMCE